MAGCSPSGSQQTASSSRIVTPARTTPPPPACALAQDEPAPPDGVTSSATAWVVASGLSGPDDVYFDRDGSVLVGELPAGRIARIGGQAGIERLPQGITSPEGIARIGETLYVADQQHDRVVAIDGSGAVRTFLQLSPVAGRLGLDQIAASGTTLIVPDSARGSVLFVDQSGHVIRRVTGFARPTGAWPLPDGSVLISDENAGSVFRLQPNGARTTVGMLDVADDAVASADNRVFAISESNGRLVEVGAGALVTGLKTAQGLTLDGAGNLLVTEADAGRLNLVLMTFKLLPATGAPTALTSGQTLCVQLRTASDFTGQVQLMPGAGYTVVRQPAGIAPGVVLPDLCTTANCSIRVTAQSGDRTDSAWLSYSNS